MILLLIICEYPQVFWGPNASGSKNMNRANKQATLAFVRRTLARYQRFEETGTSCFSEPVFRDMFFKVSSQKDVSANAKDGHPRQLSDMSSAGNLSYILFLCEEYACDCLLHLPVCATVP